MKSTIDMAFEAGFKEHNGMVYVTTINDDCAKELKAFEALVRAGEREACAKVCDTTPPYPFRPSIEAAHAIRARGNT
jgi:hypothetical protein